MELARISPKHEVTIPAEVFKRLRLRAGDFLAFEESGEEVAVVRHVPRDQAWFWTEEWQAGEREVDEDIAAGRVSGPFETAEELFQHLEGHRE